MEKVSYGHKTSKARGEISLSGDKEENYDNDIAGDDTDPDQADNKNLLPGCNDSVL